MKRIKVHVLIEVLITVFLFGIAAAAIVDTVQRKSQKLDERPMSNNAHLFIDELYSPGTPRKVVCGTPQRDDRTYGYYAICTGRMMDGHPNPPKITLKCYGEPETAAACMEAFDD